MNKLDSKAGDLSNLSSKITSAKSAEKDPYQDWLMKKQERWDQRFLKICSTLATFSSCLSRQYGAVIVNGNRIVSTGYNGPPTGIKHCEGDECPRKTMGYKSGEGIEHCPALHAEENTILNAAYLGVPIRGCKMYMNCPIPCAKCLQKIINVGIVEVICTSLELYDGLSKRLLDESKLFVRTYDGDIYIPSL